MDISNPKPNQLSDEFLIALGQIIEKVKNDPVAQANIKRGLRETAEVIEELNHKRRLTSNDWNQRVRS